MVRYTVDRPTLKSSASSPWVQFPESCIAWLGFSLGCLTRIRPLAFATFIPSRVRSRIEVGFELGHHREDVEQQPSDWVGWIMD